MRMSHVCRGFAIHAFPLRAAGMMLALLAVQGAAPESHAASLADAPSMTIEAGQSWQGSYVCNRTRTPLRLTIAFVNPSPSPTRSGPAIGVRATFAFGDPRDARHSGEYLVEGAYFVGAQDLQLQPLRWLVHPPGYVMVGLHGHFTDRGRRYAGRIDSRACEDFNLASR